MRERPPMVIVVAMLPGETYARRGIFGVSGRDLPDHVRMMHPEAARALHVFEIAHPGVLHFSGMRRPPEASRRAVNDVRRGLKKSGVKPPGFSGHNFALSVDLQIAPTLDAEGWTYRDLVDEMEATGFFCHRRDGSRGHEEWHFNWLGPAPERYLDLADPKRPHTWDDPIEAYVRDLYGSQMTADVVAQRVYLAAGGYLPDARPIRLDEDEELRAAVRRFQHEWGLKVDGICGPVTQRVLKVVHARLAVTPWEEAIR